MPVCTTLVAASDSALAAAGGGTCHQRRRIIIVYTIIRTMQRTLRLPLPELVDRWQLYWPGHIVLTAVKHKHHDLPQALTYLVTPELDQIMPPTAAPAPEATAKQMFICWAFSRRPPFKVGNHLLLFILCFLFIISTDNAMYTRTYPPNWCSCVRVYIWAALLPRSLDCFYNVYLKCQLAFRNC